MKKLIFFLFFAVFSSIADAAPSVYVFPQGKVELLNSQDRLGLHFEIADHWHVYWKNSGDSGAAPKWNWTFENAELVAEHWPVPSRIIVEGLVNFGYDHEILYQFSIKPIDPNKKVKATVKLEFLICKVECIPYFTELSHEFLPHENQAKNVFEKFLYAEPSQDIVLQSQEVIGTNLLVDLRLPADLRETARNIEIFPVDGEKFKPTAPEIIPENGKFGLKLALQDTSEKDFTGKYFLIVIERLDGQKKAFEVSLQKATPAALWSVLFFAFIGGIILNFMPCVFPVLSIKAFSFLNTNPQSARQTGWAYTLGVLAAFLSLGAALLVLRAGGEQIGWGFQLQSPLITGSIGLLFFWLGLNFLGTFEIGQSLTYLGSQKTKDSFGGSFLTGVLATVIATPCTAPFMGAALGASLAMPTYQTLLVFLGLGLGMASPFLMLAYFPQVLKFLPKPGLWMQKLKEFLSFPLFATVLWLLWVISYQASSDFILYILGVFLIVSLCVWIARYMKSENTKQYFLLFIFILSFVVVAQGPTEKVSPSQAATGDVWKKFDPALVEQDVKAGKSVFIDFTAAWCITCQVNKKLVLNTAEIQKHFADNHVQIYKADWTDKDPIITKALAGYGRNSLPVYVYHENGDAQARLLPEILTKQMILDLFKKENAK